MSGIFLSALSLILNSIFCQTLLSKLQHFTYEYLRHFSFIFSDNMVNHCCKFVPRIYCWILLSSTGLSRESDITQLAAYDGEEMFNEYVKPHQTISSKASEITGLTFCFQRNQMYHHGKPVDSKDLRSALLLFIDYLSQRNLPLLVGHNIAAFDNHVLQTKLHETNLLSEFKCIVKGCVDTLKLAKAQFSKQDVGNYKQQTLVSYLLGKTYDAHDAGEDVRSLHELLSSKLEYSSKDVFPFDLQRILQSHAPMIRESALSKALANRLSNCGLSYKHLQLAYKRDPVNGIRVVLS